jgi:PAS domain S-box-containing protein
MDCTGSRQKKEGRFMQTERKEALKDLIRSLHEGADPEKMKAKFKEILEGVTPVEVARIEEELVTEGMPREEIHRLCEVHLTLFKESIEKEKVLAPEGHPINILMEEHKILLGFAGDLSKVAKALKEAGGLQASGDEMEHLNSIVEHFKDSESHYLREENVLFPHLEKHGVTQPPAIMWIEHDRIRQIEKGLYATVETREVAGFHRFAMKLEETALALGEMLSSHFYKENNVLFPTALKVIETNEWTDMRKQFDEIGYCCFTPQPAKLVVEKVEHSVPVQVTEGAITLETGSFSKAELEAMLNTLPVDITFVDKDDTVRYFSQGKDRIFVRTKAIVGRKVQQCHPQKSVHKVNQILESFKKGSRDVAEFWIDLKGRLVHIRYLAVRDKNGAYVGCLEVTQDITNIKKLEGEKRLLDWK